MASIEVPTSSIIGCGGGTEYDKYGNSASSVSTITAQPNHKKQKQQQSTSSETNEPKTTTLTKAQKKMVYKDTVDLFAQVFGSDSELCKDKEIIDIFAEAIMDEQVKLFHTPNPKKSVKWSPDVEVGGCKPGPLKSYAEYDPESPAI